MRTAILVSVVAAFVALGCSEHGSSATCSGQACCHSRADCKQTFEECFAPGQDIGCGACMLPPTTCQQDSECSAQGPTSICGVARCTCDGSMSCIAGCTSDAGCGDGLTCAANHRCVARACSDAAPCPADFDCTANGCVRRTCTTDATCDGFCVNGACFETLGFCSAPPA